MYFRNITEPAYALHIFCYVANTWHMVENVILIKINDGIFFDWLIANRALFVHRITSFFDPILL